MSERKGAGAKGSKSSKASAGKEAAGFSAEEKAAMKEYAAEKKAAAKRGGKVDKAAGEKELQAAVAKMAEPDRTMAQRLHALIMGTVPSLAPRTWYGMPAYANEEGNVVCFFQNATKFKTRYSTLGFSDKAKLDAGNMWPTAFALKELTGEVEGRIAELVRKATS